MKLFEIIAFGSTEICFEPLAYDKWYFAVYDIVTLENKRIPILYIPKIKLSNSKEMRAMLEEVKDTLNSKEINFKHYQKSIHDF